MSNRQTRRSKYESPLSTQEKRDALRRRPVERSPSLYESPPAQRRKSIQVSPPNSAFTQSSPNGYLTDDATATTTDDEEDYGVSKIDKPHRTPESAKLKKSAHNTPNNNDTSKDESFQPDATFRKPDTKMLNAGREMQNRVAEYRILESLSSKPIYVLMMCLGLFIAVAFVIPNYARPQTFYGSEVGKLHGKFEMTLEKWNSELRELKNDFPNLRSRFWPVISANVKSLMKKKEPSQPGIVLLVGRDAGAANCLARKLIGAMPSSGATLDAGDLRGAPTEVKEVLFNAMGENLAVNGSYGLLNIQKLHGAAAMTLHAYCDDQNAPYRRALIVLTLISPEKCEKNAETCAERLLSDIWNKDLTYDTLSPLVSRLTASVAVVDYEPNLRC